MYFVAEFKTVKGNYTWTENLLIRAQNEALANEVATAYAKECSSSEQELSLASVQSLTRTEFLALSRFWKTRNASGMPHDELDASLAPPEYLKKVAKHTREALAGMDVKVGQSQMLHAFAAALGETDWQVLLSKFPAIGDANYAATEAAPTQNENQIYGPRINALFIPQAWVYGYAMEVDGQRLTDVTATVLGLTLAKLHVLEDHDDSSDDLIDVMEMEHSGPFEVEVVQAVCNFFEVTALTDITQTMLDRARARAFNNEAVQTLKEPPRVMALGQAPFTPTEMERMNWHFDCVVPVPVDVLGDIEAQNDFVSQAITGNECALEDIRYEVFNHFYGVNNVAVRVMGYISSPEDFFELEESPAANTDKASLLKLVKALTRSDVFEMEVDGANTRYRIVNAKADMLGLLTHLEDMPASDWDNKGGTGVVEFVDPMYQSMMDDGQWFSLEELATAIYQTDGSFELTYNEEKAIVRFF